MGAHFFNNKNIEILFNEINFLLEKVQSRYDNNYSELNLKRSNYILFYLRSNLIRSRNLCNRSHSLNCKNKTVLCNCQYYSMSELHKVFKLNN